MSQFNDVKRLKEAAASKFQEGHVASRVAHLAGDAVVKVSSAVDGAESVAKRAGLTNRKGDVSKIKIAKQLARPTRSAKLLLSATAEELQKGRAASEGTTVQPLLGEE